MHGCQGGWGVTTAIHLLQVPGWSWAGVIMPHDDTLHVTDVSALDHKHIHLSSLKIVLYI